MSTITNLTRMWLTRSIKPFIFTNEFDEQLSFAECRNLGLYVHIPFCSSICNFCPYCKIVYSKEACDRYIDALIKEVHMSGRLIKSRKAVTSLYFGGGTPALAAGRIKEIIEAIQKHFMITEGIGVELHPDNVNVPLLQTLKDAGVTKIIKNALKSVSFETVSMDFIFALPGQTFEDLKSDIDTAFANGANHIVIYPFIDFTFTESPVRTMAKREKRKLLDAITGYCLDKGYIRDSIWTFSKGENVRYSSMTRDNFLGFGCSATTLLQEQFKINTFSVEEYCGRIDKGLLPTSLTIRFTLRQRMVYYLFWTAYSTKVDPADFEEFFKVPLKKMYGFEFWIAKCLGFLREEKGVYHMTLKGAFYYHYYENFYTLSYIDKMWGLMQKEAFPRGMEL